LLKDDKKKLKDIDSVKNMLDDITDSKIDTADKEKSKDENDKKDDKEVDADQIDSNTGKD
jgi:hypothetical protein